VRVAGLGALAAVGSNAEEARQIEDDPDPEVRARVRSMLAAAEAGPRLAVAALSDPHTEVRLAAGWALARLDVPVPAAGPSLVQLLREFPEQRGMREIFEGAGFRGLAVYLRCDLRDLRVDEPNTAILLRPTDSSEDLEALVAELEHKEHGADLVAALRATLDSRQDEILLATLADGSIAVREASATLLGLLARDREACVAGLEKALRDEEEGVRAAAAAALERLRRDPR
jgi:HEAT repeat protein